MKENYLLRIYYLAQYQTKWNLKKIEKKDKKDSAKNINLAICAEINKPEIKLKNLTLTSRKTCATHKQRPSIDGERENEHS